MTDVIAGQIITGIVTVIGFAFQYLMGQKRTRKAKAENEQRDEKVIATVEAVVAKVDTVHELVNGASKERTAENEALKGEIGKLNTNLGSLTPSGSAPGIQPLVTMKDGVVETHVEKEP